MSIVDYEYELLHLRLLNVQQNEHREQSSWCDTTEYNSERILHSAIRLALLRKSCSVTHSQTTELRSQNAGNFNTEVESRQPNRYLSTRIVDDVSKHHSNNIENEASKLSCSTIVHCALPSIHFSLPSIHERYRALIERQALRASHKALRRRLQQRREELQLTRITHANDEGKHYSANTASVFLHNDELLQPLYQRRGLAARFLTAAAGGSTFFAIQHNFTPIETSLLTRPQQLTERENKAIPTETINEVEKVEYDHSLQYACPSSGYSDTTSFSSVERFEMKNMTHLSTQEGSLSHSQSLSSLSWEHDKDDDRPEFVEQSEYFVEHHQFHENEKCAINANNQNVKTPKSAEEEENVEELLSKEKWTLEHSNNTQSVTNFIVSSSVKKEKEKEWYENKKKQGKEQQEHSQQLKKEVVLPMEYANAHNAPHEMESVKQENEQALNEQPSKSLLFSPVVHSFKMSHCITCVTFSPSSCKYVMGSTSGVIWVGLTDKSKEGVLLSTTLGTLHRCYQSRKKNEKHHHRTNKHKHKTILNNSVLGLYATKSSTSKEDSCENMINESKMSHLIELHGHTNAINDIAFNDTGNMFVSAASDYSLIVWNAQTHSKLRRLHASIVLRHTPFASSATKNISSHISNNNNNKTSQHVLSSRGKNLGLLRSFPIKVRFIPHNNNYLLVCFAADDLVRLYNVSTGLPASSGEHVNNNNNKDHSAKTQAGNNNEKMNMSKRVKEKEDWQEAKNKSKKITDMSTVPSSTFSVSKFFSFSSSSSSSSSDGANNAITALDVSVHSQPFFFTGNSHGEVAMWTYYGDNTEMHLPGLYSAESNTTSGTKYSSNVSYESLNSFLQDTSLSTEIGANANSSEKSINNDHLHEREKEQHKELHEEHFEQIANSSKSKQCYTSASQHVPLVQPYVPCLRKLACITLSDYQHYNNNNNCNESSKGNTLMNYYMNKLALPITSLNVYRLNYLQANNLVQHYLRDEMITGRKSWESIFMKSKETLMHLPQFAEKITSKWHEFWHSRTPTNARPPQSKTNSTTFDMYNKSKSKPFTPSLQTTHTVSALPSYTSSVIGSHVAQVNTKSSTNSISYDNSFNSHHVNQNYGHKTKMFSSNTGSNSTNSNSKYWTGNSNSSNNNNVLSAVHNNRTTRNSANDMYKNDFISGALSYMMWHLRSLLLVVTLPCDSVMLLGVCEQNDSTHSSGFMHSLSSSMSLLPSDKGSSITQSRNVTSLTSAESCNTISSAHISSSSSMISSPSSSLLIPQKKKKKKTDDTVQFVIIKLMEIKNVCRLRHVAPNNITRILQASYSQSHLQSKTCAYSDANAQHMIREKGQEQEQQQEEECKNTLFISSAGAVCFANGRHELQLVMACPCEEGFVHFVAPSSATVEGSASLTSVIAPHYHTLLSLAVPDGDRLSGLAWSPNGRFLIATTADGVVYEWERVYLLSDNIDLHKSRNSYHDHSNVALNMSKAQQTGHVMKQNYKVNELHKSSYEEQTLPSSESLSEYLLLSSSSSSSVLEQTSTKPKIATTTDENVNVNVDIYGAASNNKNYQEKRVVLHSQDDDHDKCKSTSHTVNLSFQASHDEMHPSHSHSHKTQRACECEKEQISNKKDFDEDVEWQKSLKAACALQRKVLGKHTHTIQPHSHQRYRQHEQEQLDRRYDVPVNNTNTWKTEYDRNRYTNDESSLYHSSYSNESVNSYTSESISNENMSTTTTNTFATSSSESESANIFHRENE